MRKIFFLTLMMSASTCWLFAQQTPKSDSWIINEVYTSDKPKRYGLFLELYNPSDPKGKVPYNFYVSDSKKNPQQSRVASKAKYTPDFRSKGYRTFKVSAVRFKRRSVRLYNTVDTLYLFTRSGYEYQLRDSFPVIWNDSLSLGRCGNRICYFNIPTPGRKNKNVAPLQYMPRKNYAITVLGGTGHAINAGNGVGYFPSFGIRAQKITNKRIIYTATSAALFFQGYSFKSTEEKITPTGDFTRTIDGYYSAIELWIGEDIGLFLTPRFALSGGIGIVPITIASQVYDETITLVKPDNTVDESSQKQHENIGRYSMPLITFNAGLNYQLTPKIKIETLCNILFRTFQKNETIYYQSFNIGLSYSFKHKGRGYREGLLW